MQGRIRSVCVSREPKAQAEYVGACEVDCRGMHGDIHYGTKKSAVSLLPARIVEQYFLQRKEGFKAGRFGENLLVEGLDWTALRPRMRLLCGEAVLEIERIGAGGAASQAYTGYKVCTPMEPYFVFCAVVKPGRLESGQTIRITDALQNERKTEETEAGK